MDSMPRREDDTYTTYRDLDLTKNNPTTSSCNPDLTRLTFRYRLHLEISTGRKLLG